MPTIGDGSFPTAAAGFDPKRSQPVAGPPAWRGRWARRGPTRDKEVFSRVERENRRDSNPDLPHTLAAKHQGRAGIGRCPVDRRSGADLRLFRVPGQVAHDVDDPNFERRAAAAYLELRPADFVQSPTVIRHRHGGLPAAVFCLNCQARPYSSAPNMRLERRLQRRICDVAGVIGDRRGRDHRDHFEQVILAEARGKERLAVLIGDPAALFDQRPRERRECAELAVIRANGRRGWRPRPPGSRPSFRARAVWKATAQAQAFVTALVRSSVCICVSVKLPPWTRPNRPTRLLISTGDVAIAPAMLGMIPKAACRSCSAGFEASGAVLMV